MMAANRSLSLSLLRASCPSPFSPLEKNQQLADNLEWLDGYTKRFGIVWVDYKGGSLKREPKDSAAFLSKHFFKVGRA